MKFMNIDIGLKEISSIVFVFGFAIGYILLLFNNRIGSLISLTSSIGGLIILATSSSTKISEVKQ